MAADLSIDEVTRRAKIDQGAHDVFFHHVEADSQPGSDTGLCQPFDAEQPENLSAARRQAVDDSLEGFQSLLQVGQLFR
jgi:hypothetical protein